MSKKLITLVFEKAERETGSSVKTRLAQYLSDILLEDYKYQISERRLRDYYTNYIEKEDGNKESLRPQLIEPLCKYLGYDNYAGFVVDHPSEIEVSIGEKVEEEKGMFEKYKEALILAFSAITITCLTYFGFVKVDENCMVWKGNHYEKTACTGAPLESPFEELILKEFRKIEHFDSLMIRKTKGKELWYDKSNGKVEFFTYPGRHPVSNDPLKNVTDYIFKTYVLDKRKDTERIGLSD